MARPKKDKTDRKTQTIRALRERIKQLEVERNSYLHSLNQLLPVTAFRLTRKERRAMEKFRPTFSEFVKQLEAEVKAEKQHGR